MADEKQNYRMERIERLLKELEHEITRGMMEGEVDETLAFDFYIPVAKSIPDGVVRCQFRTRPVPREDWLALSGGMARPRLRVVK